MSEKATEAIQCEKLEGAICLVASELADRDVETHSAICRRCLGSRFPKDVNRATVEAAIKEVSKDIRKAGKVQNPTDDQEGDGAILRGLLAELSELGGLDPSLAKKAGNFSKAIAKDVKRKGVRVPEKVRGRRMTLCRSCELYNQEKGTCRHPRCGCVMQRKTRWASSECPIGRWGEWFEGEEEVDR